MHRYEIITEGLKKKEHNPFVTVYSEINVIKIPYLKFMVVLIVLMMILKLKMEVI